MDDERSTGEDILEYSGVNAQYSGSQQEESSSSSGSESESESESGYEPPIDPLKLKPPASFYERRYAYSLFISDSHLN